MTTLTPLANTSPVPLADIVSQSITGNQVRKDPVTTSDINKEATPPAERALEIPKPQGMLGKVEYYFDLVTEKLQIQRLNRFVVDLTKKLPEPFGELLRQLWKVHLLVILFFLLPQMIVMTGMVLTCAVTLLYPKAFEGHPRIQQALIGSMGFYSAIHFVVNLTSMGIIASAIHVVVCFICFRAMRSTKNEPEKRAPVATIKFHTAALRILKKEPKKTTEEGQESANRSPDDVKKDVIAAVKIASEDHPTTAAVLAIVAPTPAVAVS